MSAHPGCKFYGCSAVLDMGLMWKPPGHSNRCGLVVASHTPCLMELRNQTPNLETFVVKIALAPNLFE